MTSVESATPTLDQARLPEVVPELPQPEMAAVGDESGILPVPGLISLPPRDDPPPAPPGGPGSGAPDAGNRRPPVPQIRRSAALRGGGPAAPDSPRIDLRPFRGPFPDPGTVPGKRPRDHRPHPVLRRSVNPPTASSVIGSGLPVTARRPHPILRRTPAATASAAGESTTQATNRYSGTYSWPVNDEDRHFTRAVTTLLQRKAAAAGQKSGPDPDVTQALMVGELTKAIDAVHSSVKISLDRYSDNRKLDRESPMTAWVVRGIQGDTGNSEKVLYQTTSVAQDLAIAAKHALAAGDVMAAADLLDQATDAARQAAMTARDVDEATSGSAGLAVTYLEQVKFASQAILALAGGFAAGAAVAAVTIGAGLTETAALTIQKAISGEPIDWGDVALDVILQVGAAALGARMAKPLENYLPGLARQSAPLAKLMANKGAAAVAQLAVVGLVNSGTNVMTTAVRDAVAAVRGKPITLGDFADHLAATFSPRNILIAVAAGAKSPDMESFGAPGSQGPEPEITGETATPDGRSAFGEPGGQGPEPELTGQTATPDGRSAFGEPGGDLGAGPENLGETSAPSAEPSPADRSTAGSTPADSGPHGDVTSSAAALSAATTPDYTATGTFKGVTYKEGPNPGAAQAGDIAQHRHQGNRGTGLTSEHMNPAAQHRDASFDPKYQDSDYYYRTPGGNPGRDYQAALTIDLPKPVSDRKTKLDNAHTRLLKRTKRVETSHERIINSLKRTQQAIDYCLANGLITPEQVPDPVHMALAAAAQEWGSMSDAAGGAKERADAAAQGTTVPDRDPARRGEQNKARLRARLSEETGPTTVTDETFDQQWDATFDLGDDRPAGTGGTQ